MAITMAKHNSLRFVGDTHSHYISTRRLPGDARYRATTRIRHSLHHCVLLSSPAYLLIDPGVQHTAQGADDAQNARADQKDEPRLS